MIPPACHHSPKAIPARTKSLSDPCRSCCLVSSASVPVIFSLALPPHLPLSPSAVGLSSRLITFVLILPRTFRPGGFTCNSCICLYACGLPRRTLLTGIVWPPFVISGLLEFYTVIPYPHLTITLCCSTFLIPAEIKF